MKTCFKCGEEKPLAEFYRHPRMADGHLNKCKTCAKADVARHRSENIDALREYDRQRATRPERREQAKRVYAEWKRANPARRAAQVALGAAVRDGRVAPWPACSFPEGCEETKVEAHHADYSRPLDVVWLCAPHHKQAHALFTRLVPKETRQ